MNNIYGTTRYPHNAAALPTGARIKQAELDKGNAQKQNADRAFYLWERMIRASDGDNIGLQRAIIEEARGLLAETGGAA